MSLNSSEGKLSWGIIGTGAIAHKFAKGVLGSRAGRLVAVGSRSADTANKFADEFGIASRHGSYERLLADPQVQAVYIATPHPQHAEWAIKAAEAKKHILCEKPLGINHAEAMAIIDAAVEHDVFLMEAFMYRCHPQIRKLVELIGEKAIGDVRVIQAAFSFHGPKPYDPTSRAVEHRSAGGGILDVGCYPISFARLIAGAATGKPFADPVKVKGVGHLGPERTDDYAAAVLRFPGDIIAQVSTGVQVEQENVARIYGSDGSIFVGNPWIPNREPGTSKIILKRDDEEKPREIEVRADRGLYSLEADTVAENVARRQAPPPAMTWDDTLGNMKALDAWRAQIELVYDMESAPALTQTLARRPLAVRSQHNMRYGRIAGLDKDISRLVMGVDNQRTIAHLTAMFDHFFERGGNAFDTAYIYLQGNPEILMGQWIRNRGVRDRIVLIGKGAHTPYCDPKNLTRQLLESLERLQVDCLDIYMLHRDNPEVPAGEFVDVLNEHHRAGRVKIFGGSNWSIERMEAANEYARSRGLRGFDMVSNNFSLARMVEPVWRGCIAASDARWRAWLSETQMPLFAWSSQARGFFTDRSDPRDQSDAELARTWYADDNFERKRRAVEMARRRGVSPMNIALAYVLNQPFPTFPLIGPRALSETRDSLKALDVTLSADELRWLNLDDRK